LNFAMQFDPYEVLGIDRSASLAEIRDAYRARTKTHHPDVGGSAWAFRVLTRSYEIVSTARVMGRAGEESARAEAAPRPASTNGPETPSSKVASGEGRTRAGAVDSRVEPSHRVAVEMLLLRYQIDDPSDLFSGEASDRNLSCNLNIQWPAPGEAAEDVDRRPLMASLARAVEKMIRDVPPVSQKISPSDSRFGAWLSYASAVDADRAFQTLRAAIRPAGLGVEETIREISIPRDWSH
jgi:hypothetical protein